MSALTTEECSTALTTAAATHNGIDLRIRRGHANKHAGRRRRDRSDAADEDENEDAAPRADAQLESAAAPRPIRGGQRACALLAAAACRASPGIFAPGGDRALDDASVDADADRSKDTRPLRLGGDGDGEASAPAKEDDIEGVCAFWTVAGGSSPILCAVSSVAWYRFRSSATSAGDAADRSALS